MSEALTALGIPKQRRSWPLWFGLAVFVGGAGVGGWFWVNKPKERVRFVTAAAKKMDLSVKVTATGSLSALNSVDISAEISGRVSKVLVDFNDTVTAGQPLLELNTDQLEAQMAEARGSIAQAQAGLTVATSMLEEARDRARRSAVLFQQRLTTEELKIAADATLARAEAEVLTARARVAVASAAISQSRANMRRAVIVSPISGVVLSRTVEPGQTIAATLAAPVLFQIAEDLARLELNVDIDEADIGRVREGQDATFTVDAYPERTFHAKIRSLRFAPRVVQNVVTYQGVLTVDNDDRELRPGMTATALITTNVRPGVICVPTVALRFAPPAAARREKRDRARDSDEKKPHVWIDQPDGIPKLVEVTPGLSDGQFTEVRGIEAGALVIVDVQRTLPPPRR